MPPHSAAASRRAASDEIKATPSQAPQGAEKSARPRRTSPARQRHDGTPRNRRQRLLSGRTEALATPYHGDALSSYQRPTDYTARRMPPHSAAASRRAASDEIKATPSQAPKSAKKSARPRRASPARQRHDGTPRNRRQRLLSGRKRGDALSSYQRPIRQLAACLRTRLPLLGAPRVTKSRRRPRKRRKEQKKARGPVQRRLLGNAMTRPRATVGRGCSPVGEGSIGDALSSFQRPIGHLAACGCRFSALQVRQSLPIVSI